MTSPSPGMGGRGGGLSHGNPLNPSTPPQPASHPPPGEDLPLAHPPEEVLPSPRLATPSLMQVSRLPQWTIINQALLDPLPSSLSPLCVSYMAWLASASLPLPYDSLLCSSCHPPPPPLLLLYTTHSRKRVDLGPVPPCAIPLRGCISPLYNPIP